MRLSRGVLELERPPAHAADRGRAPRASAVTRAARARAGLLQLRVRRAMRGQVDARERLATLVACDRAWLVGAGGVGGRRRAAPAAFGQWVVREGEREDDAMSIDEAEDALPDREGAASNRKQ